METTETITRKALIEALLRSKGAAVVTIETVTVPTLLAKNPDTGEVNPYKGRLIKAAVVNGILGFHYERSVNRQRGREDKPGTFEALPRQWGERIKGTSVVRHVTKDGVEKHYVELKVEKSIDHDYLDEDGNVVDPELVKPFLPRRKPGRQEVDREVILRDYSIDSIVAAKVSGKAYAVTAD